MHLFLISPGMHLPGTRMPAGSQGPGPAGGHLAGLQVEKHQPLVAGALGSRGRPRGRKTISRVSTHPTGGLKPKKFPKFPNFKSMFPRPIIGPNLAKTTSFHPSVGLSSDEVGIVQLDPTKLQKSYLFRRSILLPPPGPSIKEV